MSPALLAATVAAHVAEDRQAEAQRAYDVASARIVCAKTNEEFAAEVKAANIARIVLIATRGATAIAMGELGRAFLADVIAVAKVA